MAARLRLVRALPSSSNWRNQRTGKIGRQPWMRGCADTWGMWDGTRWWDAGSTLVRNQHLTDGSDVADPVGAEVFLPIG